MPSLVDHLNDVRQPSLQDLYEIALDPRHLKCFFFMMLLMFSQFTVIPFIGTSLVVNGGLSENQLPLVYLIGGLATAISNPIIGRLSDTYNKPLLFKICAVIAWIPLLLLTQQGPSSLLFSLFATTLFFIFNSGRMSPAMAIITSVVNPSKRGRFMSLNSAVQQSCSGLAAWIGGMLVTTGVGGHLEGLANTGYISIVAGFCSVLWVSRLEFARAKI